MKQERKPERFQVPDGQTCGCRGGRPIASRNGALSPTTPRSLSLPRTWMSLKKVVPWAPGKSRPSRHRAFTPMWPGTEDSVETTQTTDLKKQWGASLVAQWLRIHLPMQGTRVRALVWEDPTCRGAAKPMRHNYWGCAPQLLKPVRLEPVLCNEKPLQWGACTPQWRPNAAKKKKIYN